MRRIIQLLILMIVSGCRKDAEEPAFNVNGFEISNITANSIQIRYKLYTPAGLNQTGVFFSKDSSLLAMHGLNLDKVISSNTGSEFTCQLSNLEPETRYWVQVYVIHSGNQISYLKPVVTKTAGFNLTISPYFRRAIKAQRISLHGENMDTVKKNYKVFYDTSACNIVYIKGNPANEYTLLFTIPITAPLGDHEIVVKYKDKLIYRNYIEVLKGAFYTRAQVPEMKGFSNNFTYNNELYFYYGPGNFVWFRKWNPGSGTFSQLSAPNINPELPQWEPGWEINGKIYFAPFTCNTAFGSAFCARSPNVEKLIYSYDPVLKTWEKNTLVHSDVIPTYAGLYTSFVYRNKLYCIIVHSTDGNKRDILLKAFDPADMSWSTVLDSVPFKEAYGCKAAVIGDKIYVLSTLMSTSSTYGNELYSLDFDTKTFTKKSIWSDPNVGSLNPFFFAYKNHLFFYGGRHSFAYMTSSEDHSYEYSPESDTWTPLSSCYLPSVAFTTSALGGFLSSANNRIYLGFGWSNYRDGNIDAWGDRIYEYILD